MDQVVLGVVINTLILGLTGYLYDDLMIPYQNTLNSPATFSAIKLPLLGDIPIIGPVFFDSTIFLYLTYIALAGVQVGLFSTRWGLRTRAIGEHPVAADTVGIPVLAMRYRNVIAAGIIAGVGGAYFTIGSVGVVRQGHVVGRGLHRARRDDLRTVLRRSARSRRPCCSGSPPSCSRSCPR